MWENDLVGPSLLWMEVGIRSVGHHLAAFCSFRRLASAVNRRVSRSTYMSERRRRRCCSSSSRRDVTRRRATFYVRDWWPGCAGSGAVEHSTRRPRRYLGVIHKGRPQGKGRYGEEGKEREKNAHLSCGSHGSPMEMGIIFRKWERTGKVLS